MAHNDSSTIWRTMTLQQDGAPCLFNNMAHHDFKNMVQHDSSTRWRTMTSKIWRTMTLQHGANDSSTIWRTMTIQQHGAP
jgi:hypothetical protein